MCSGTSGVGRIHCVPVASDISSHYFLGAGGFSAIDTYFDFDLTPFACTRLESPVQRTPIPQLGGQARVNCMSTITTTDGAKLSYKLLGSEGDPVLLLIHGWSGSSRYFVLNSEKLAMSGMRILAVDLRFHGDSDKTQHGFHVARLAADVHELLQQLQLSEVNMLGTSMVWL